MKLQLDRRHMKMFRRFGKGQRLMTPCMNAVKKAKIFYKVHEYRHEPTNQSYGAEAAEKLGVSQEQVFKTLVVNIGGKKLAVAIVPVSSTLNMKLMAKAVGVKKAEMADAADVARSTGYVLGGVSPLGQKKKHTTVIHSSAGRHSTVFVSAGRRGLQIELKPNDLKYLTHGKFADICQ